MRIFELLTQAIAHAVPACSAEHCLNVGRIVAEQEAILARNKILASSARDAMVASLREELTWRARLEANRQSLEEAATRWQTAQQQMMDHLACDREELQRLFFDGEQTGQVTDIAPDLSDRHDGARSVAILTFEGGCRVVYKPRSLATESWFYGFLAAVNELGAPLPFATLRTMDCGEYGWVEFAEHRHCRDEAELRDYYRHAGALLCLLRLLRASDCHFQNLVARGSQPVPVDVETLFHPLSAEQGAFTVADTAMLPSLERSYDLGALSCVTPQQVLLDLPGVTTSPVTLTPRENLPSPSHRLHSPHDFAGEMAEGFTLTWNFVVQSRERIVGLLEPARELRVRILPRDTAEYYRQMLLLALGKPCDSSLSEQEMAALRRFEVPRFEVAACDGTGSSGCAAALQEIAALDVQGLARELKMMRLLWTIYGSMRGFEPETDKISAT